MPKPKEIFLRSLSKLIGLVVFFILLFLLNYLRIHIQNQLYDLIVDFLNKNIILFVLIFLMFFIAEIFEMLDFPLNLPAPLLNAIGALFVVSFIFKIFYFVDVVLEIEAFSIIKQFELFQFAIYVFVFVVVLIWGYASIFMNIKKSGSRRKKDE